MHYDDIKDQNEEQSDVDAVLKYVLIAWQHYFHTVHLVADINTLTMS
jgi:hypothetical protein